MFEQFFLRSEHETVAHLIRVSTYHVWRIFRKSNAPLRGT